MFLIAIIGATLADPTATHQPDPRALFQANDYPADAMRSRETGSVITSLLIDQIGKVERCTVIYSSKSLSLDQTTCKILTERARFRPAMDDAGKPIYSVIISPPITWWLSDGPQPPIVKLKPDAEIGLSAAPADIRLPIDVSVNYVVTANGHIHSCKASSPGRYPEALVAIACEPSSLPVPLPTKNKAGQRVDVLYTSTAHFIVGKP